MLGSSKLKVVEALLAANADVDAQWLVAWKSGEGQGTIWTYRHGPILAILCHINIIAAS